MELPNSEGCLEWSEHNAFLSGASNSGVTERFVPYSYQREILDALTPGKHSVNDVPVWKMSVMKPSRIGFNKMITSYLGYLVDRHPRQIGIYQPTMTMALETAKEDIMPLLLDTPALSHTRAILEENTHLKRSKICNIRINNNCFIVLSSATASSFRRRNFATCIIDEVDAMPQTIGKDGDVVSLAEARTRSNVDRMLIIGSSPLLSENSIIQREYNLSDKRMFYVPCPHCGHFQLLEWERFIWKKGEPESVYFPCSNCGKKILPKHKSDMVDQGEWRPTTKAVEDGHVGFHLHGTCVKTPHSSWPELVRNVEKSGKSLEQLQSFYNTVIGVPFSVTSHFNVDPDKLFQFLDKSYVKGEVPNDVLMLCAGIDVQGGDGGPKDRLEMSVWGFSEYKQCFIENYVFLGNPSHDAVWAKVKAAMNKVYATTDGRKLKPYLAFCDSGGHASEAVYRHCRENDFLMASKGGPSRDADVWRVGKNNMNESIIILCTHKIKLELFQRVKYLINNGVDKSYFRLPSNFEIIDCHKLCSEVLEKMNKSNSTLVWKKKAGGPANELLDCAVYAMSAFKFVISQFPVRTVESIAKLGAVQEESIINHEPPEKKEEGDNFIEVEDFEIEQF